MSSLQYLRVNLIHTYLHCRAFTNLSDLCQKTNFQHDFVFTGKVDSVSFEHSNWIHYIIRLLYGRHKMINFPHRIGPLAEVFRWTLTLSDVMSARTDSRSSRVTWTPVCTLTNCCGTIITATERSASGERKRRKGERRRAWPFPWRWNQKHQFNLGVVVLIDTVIVVFILKLYLTFFLFF